MAVMWQGSLIPWIDASGDPYASAEAYFFDAGTTTPKVTYTDSALSIPHDHPVVANASGMFPAIFLVEETTYRLRILDADDATIHDVDGISVPTTTPPEPPEGVTEAQYLYQTGDIKFAWRTSAPTGYVRLNGRTIGSASSGATERANADTSALFAHLWTEDANLAVSGGRGGSAVGDFAANKTIALPDWRGRIPLGMDSMGNSAAGRVTDAQLGADSDLLGAAGGAAAVTLTQAETPVKQHNHGVTDAGHSHVYPFSVVTVNGGSGGASVQGGSSFLLATNSSTNSSTTGLTVNNASSDTATAHNNLQPSVVVPFFIKL